jgi:flagellar hook capping protein FlgD
MAARSSGPEADGALIQPSARPLIGSAPSQRELTLRKTGLAIVVALAAALGSFAPGSHVPATRAASDAKVVIIVGAVHGQTSSYRQRGESAYQEAIKYSTNVVKVFSPYATWAAVKAAVKGARVVIYMGHGNGWPSPYTYDPLFTTKDGFGLNAAAGNGDYNNKYYGEPSIRTLEFAPNALILLHHLCYAAGNSEPGLAEPSLSVAKQRADNYASAFLAAGASAVIADGHSGPEYYLASLFNTNQTLDQMWRSSPNANGNTYTFASVRSPGKTVSQDPESPTSEYYRSASGTMSLTTGDVLGSGAPAPPPPAATDLIAPVVTAATTPGSFSPNGDGIAERITLGWSADEPVTGYARIRKGGTVFKTWAIGATGSLVWDGLDRTGRMVADGLYHFSIEVSDPSANRTLQEVAFSVDRTAGQLVWSPALFFPHDGDAYAKTSKVSFRLARTAATTLQIYTQAGEYVKTAWVDRTLAAGTWGWTWNGVDGGGARVPRGWYRAVLTATSWVGTTTVTKLVLVDAFSVIAAPVSPTGGQTLALTLRSAEPLRAAPRVTFGQAGVAAVTKAATSLGGGRYIVRFTVLAGAPGPATIGIWARDTAGRTNSQSLTITVQ